jgi:hypothetical protein
MIRARDHKATPKIRIDPRTGLPTVEEVKPKERRTSKKDSTLGLSSATDERSDDDADRREMLFMFSFMLLLTRLSSGPCYHCTCKGRV